MNVIPHRGVWGRIDQQNTLAAIHDALALFDGVEIDIRDQHNGVQVAHDAFSSGPRFDDVLAGLDDQQRKKFFALNIKADGLGPRLRELLRSHGIRRYGCFDLSFPERRRYRELGLAVLDRRSDLEVAHTGATAEVVDGFYADPPVSTLSATRLQLLISPELHGRDPAPFWRQLRARFGARSSQLFICTDFPFELRAFLDGP